MKAIPAQKKDVLSLSSENLPLLKEPAARSRLANQTLNSLLWWTSLGSKKTRRV